MKVCKKCKKHVVNKAKICKYCGADVSKCKIIKTSSNNNQKKNNVPKPKPELKKDLTTENISKIENIKSSNNNIDKLPETKSKKENNRKKTITGIVKKTKKIIPEKTNNNQSKKEKKQAKIKPNKLKSKLTIIKKTPKIESDKKTKDKNKINKKTKKNLSIKTKTTPKSKREKSTTKFSDKKIIKILINFKNKLVTFLKFIKNNIVKFIKWFKSKLLAFLKIIKNIILKIGSKFKNIISKSFKAVAKKISFDKTWFTSHKSLLKKTSLAVAIIILIGGIGLFSVLGYRHFTNYENTIVVGEKATTDKLFSMGDLITYDGVNYKVLSVETSQGNNYKSPDEGNEFLIVTVYIENTTDHKIRYSYENWTMSNSTGEEETRIFTSINVDTALYSGDLVIGGIKKGSMVFEQPKNDDKLRLNFYDLKTDEEGNDVIDKSKKIFSVSIKVPDETEKNKKTVTTSKDENVTKELD